MKPIKTAILLEDLEFGGTQRYAVNLLRHLNRDLFDPELWVLRHGADMARWVGETGVTIEWLTKARWVDPTALAHLAARIIQRRPHILYTLTALPNIWGRLFGKALGVPVIVSGYRSLYPKQYERVLWRLSRRIVCNTEASKEILIRDLRIDNDRIAVVPNGVDIDVFSPAPGQEAEEPTVLYVGRLVRDKDPLTLVAAFRLVSESVPEARFEMVGNGPLKAQVAALIRSHDLESKIRLMDGTRDVMGHLRRAWVFALASESEASPNVVIEAMAAGVPVVATRVGGIPELLREGETGLLVEPHSPAQMAKAITDLLRNESLRLSMGEKARQRAVSVYSLAQVTRLTETVLLESVNGRPRVPEDH